MEMYFIQDDKFSLIKSSSDGSENLMYEIIHYAFVR